MKQVIECNESICSQLTGKDITIAILDTGICEHPDFSHRVTYFADFVNGKNIMYDDSGHGTHVCGIAAGNGYASRGKYKGIAPEANLIVGKVLDQYGDGEGDDMVRGIEWILELKKKVPIHILNLSIGMKSFDNEALEKKLIEAVEEAWNSGLIVVTAAGNNGPRPMTISPIGSSRKVITVGCHDGGYVNKNGTNCEYYSSRGPSKYDIKKPDIVAPGSDIMSCSNQITKSYYNYNRAYLSKSGTSMATPIVSGSCALLLEQFPNLSNDMAKRILVRSAVDLNENWYKQGWGMLNVKNMLLN